MPHRPASRGIVDRALRERHLTAKVPLEPENPGLCLEFVRGGLVGQTVTVRSAPLEREATGMHVAPIDGRELYWAFVVHRQRHEMAPVRTLAGIVKSTLADAVRSGPWSGASIVG
jgi:hypothetical protein